ncbi:thioredoxin family protein [Sphingomonas sp. LB-2]|uniref:thioredoxin family protein n=1 Tax=Sphingomonas caeni TaxID=2984949 RepID=UPI002231F519|nr:thioredoxin family protein [Sphingomonas caeni]MCW3845876.1 thioredoxin family protein [Sphingomonas caeni]
MIHRRSLLALPLIAFLPAFRAPGSPAPRVSIGTVAQLPRPLPAPYDATADATSQVDAALKRARRSHKPLLIDFGANWCADCRVLAGVLELPEMRGWVAHKFELVQVDVGRFDRNLDIAKRFTGQALGAIPAVFIVDAKSSKLRNAESILALGDARVMRPQAIADWLAQWTS